MAKRKGPQHTARLLRAIAWTVAAVTFVYAPSVAATATDAHLGMSLAAMLAIALWFSRKD